MTVSQLTHRHGCAAADGLRQSPQASPPKAVERIGYGISLMHKAQRLYGFARFCSAHDNGPCRHADALAENRQDEQELYNQLTLFGDVLEQVRRNYVDAPSDKELIEAALSGMMASLDPHSAYLPPKNFEDMQVETKGEFGGLGIEVTMENGLVKVIAPIDDTPASRAGMRPNDLISELDDKPVLGLTLSEAVDLMRGEKASRLR